MESMPILQQSQPDTMPESAVLRSEKNTIETDIPLEAIMKSTPLGAAKQEVVDDKSQQQAASPEAEFTVAGASVPSVVEVVATPRHEDGVEAGHSKSSTSQGTKNDESHLQSPIVYKVEFLNENTNDVVHQAKVKELPKESITGDSSTVFEVVDMRWTWLTTVSTGNQKSGDSPKQSDIVSLSDLPPSFYRDRLKMNILSPAVIEALRCVVDYYPDTAFSGSQLVFEQPFSEVYWYRDALTELQQSLDSEPCQLESCRMRHAQKHIQLVQDFVEGQIAGPVKAEKERHERGMATFEMLWLLFRPGQDVYFDNHKLKEYEPYVVKSATHTRMAGTAIKLEVELWNINANARILSPKETVVELPAYAGEKAINSLQIFPCQYLEKDSQGRSAEEARSFFIERGKKFVELQKKGCWSFNGISSTFPRRPYTDFAMTDPVQVELEFDNPYPLAVEFERDDRVSTTNCCSSCTAVLNRLRKPFKFANYANVSIYETDKLTSHQYFLCDRSVLAFLFKNREWKYLDVSGFHKAEYDGRILDTLVLDREVKDLVLNLTRKYVQSREFEETKEDKKTAETRLLMEGNGQWSADFVKGKGEGLIFLLHGRPGVGKTYTAESISAHLERPLLALTCADLGTNPNQIEQNLLKWFKVAARWNAILLIDEADIYMEHRQVQDLDRNNLVACLLRAMEYYKGILFLTTNRVGHFDEAFISRINIAIYYDDFPPKGRQGVWEAFFSKLEREREGVFKITERTRDFVAENEKLESLKWNGREIRNAFQIAVSLAEVEGDKDDKGRILIKPNHITPTLKMSMNFKDYLEKLRKKNLESMAAAWGNRLDAYGKSSGARAFD